MTNASELGASNDLATLPGRLGRGLESCAFVVLLLLHFSVVISILTDKCKTLSQDLALLKAEMKNKAPGAAGGGETREAGDGG